MWGEIGSTLVGAVGSAASGGILGAALGIGTKFLQERSRRKWAKAEWDHELSLLKLQADTRREETEAEIRVVSETSRGRALSQTHQSESILLSHDKMPSAIIAIRALWRPVLTASLFGIVVLLWFELTGLMKGTSDTLAFLDMATVHDLLSVIVNSVVFTANTAALWWFADRTASMPHYKHK